MSFSLKDGAVFNWRGGKTGHRVDLKEDMHKALTDSGVLNDLAPGVNFEIDSRCTRSDMLPKVQAAVKFAESKPGRTALITLLEKAKDGIAGRTGTSVSQ